MPTYNYRCEKCGVMEVVQPITEPALEICPQCEGPVKRVIGRNVLVLFKGSGFYSTDSKHTLGAALGSPEKDAPAEVEAKAAAPAPESTTKSSESSPQTSESTAKDKGKASEAVNK